MSCIISTIYHSRDNALGKPHIHLHSRKDKMHLQSELDYHHQADNPCDAVVPLSYTLYLYGRQTKELMPDKTFAWWSKMLPFLYSLYSSE